MAQERHLVTIQFRNDGKAACFKIGRGITAKLQVQWVLYSLLPEAGALASKVARSDIDMRGASLVAGVLLALQRQGVIAQPAA
jgi:hypothetical protein